MSKGVLLLGTAVTLLIQGFTRGGKIGLDGLYIYIAIDAKNRNDEETLKNLVYPDINAGIDGIRWIENCVRSADNGAAWIDFK